MKKPLSASTPSGQHQNLNPVQGAIMVKANSIPVTDQRATALRNTNLKELCEKLITSNLHLANLVAVMEPMVRDEMETFVACIHHFVDDEFDVIKKVEAILEAQGGAAV